MCELFGISSKKIVIANDWLRAFYSRSNEQKDGWGLAVFRGNAVSMEKEPVKASDSVYLKQRLSRNVEAEALFAHIRRATIGQIEYANCHPFIWDDASGRTWTLMHNGTIFRSDMLAGFKEKQEGATDSERILLYIIDKMDRFQQENGHAPDSGERFRLLDETVCALAPENKLNLMIYDGEYMYVHTNCRDTLHVSSNECMTAFATHPVTAEGWKQLPMNRLFAYKAGECAAEGTDHGAEYVENEQDLLTLYSAFSQL